MLYVNNLDRLVPHKTVQIEHDAEQLETGKQ